MIDRERGRERKRDRETDRERQRHICRERRGRQTDRDKKKFDSDERIQPADNCTGGETSYPTNPTSFKM